MAKILVPETGFQLSLSFEGKLDQTGTDSFRDISPQLYEQTIRATQKRFDKVFKQITFKAVARAIDASGGDEKIFLAVVKRRGLILNHIVLDILDDPSRALIGLSLNFRGASCEVPKVYEALLSDLKMSSRLRKDLSVVSGDRFIATVPIDPIARIKVGTAEIPPPFESFVLPQEVDILLPQLNALGRPYQVVAA